MPMSSGKGMRMLFRHMGAVFIGLALIGTGGCATPGSAGPGLDVESATGLSSEQVAQRLREADEAAARMEAEEVDLEGAGDTVRSRDSRSSHRPGGGSGSQSGRTASSGLSGSSTGSAHSSGGFGSSTGSAPQAGSGSPGRLGGPESRWNTAGLDDGSGQRVTWGTLSLKDEGSSGAVWREGGTGSSGGTARADTGSAVAFPSGEGGTWGTVGASSPVTTGVSLTNNEFLTTWNNVGLHVGKLGRVTYLYRLDHRMGMVANAPDKPYEKLGIKSGDWYILCDAGKKECRMRVSYRPEGAREFETALLFLYGGGSRHVVCVGEGNPRTAPVRVTVDRMWDHQITGAACFPLDESGQLMKELDRGRVMVFESAARGGGEPGWLSTYGFLEAVELMKWLYGRLIEG